MLLDSILMKCPEKADLQRQRADQRQSGIQDGRQPLAARGCGGHLPGRGNSLLQTGGTERSTW